jgi:diaminopimelate epimerase
MSGLNFTKMHGLGNDFVIIDGRAQSVAIDETRARELADRHTGIGCDQLIVIEPARNGDADVFMRIHNADGTEVGACGNATRCVASIIATEAGRSSARIETLAGVLRADIRDPRTVTVDMGEARHDWNAIPLAREQDTLKVDVASGPLACPVAVNMGNPHAVFFVDDAEAVDLPALGPGLEHHPMFPERANIGVAQLIGADRVRLRVWERGVGITLACGSGACAAGVAAHRRGLTGRKVEVVLDGGCLEIEWRPDGHVLMTGPVAVSFTGRIEDEAGG